MSAPTAAIPARIVLAILFMRCLRFLMGLLVGPGCDPGPTVLFGHRRQRLSVRVLCVSPFLPSRCPSRRRGGFVALGVLGVGGVRNCGLRRVE